MLQKYPSIYRIMFTEIIVYEKYSIDSCKYIICSNLQMFSFSLKFASISIWMISCVLRIDLWLIFCPDKIHMCFKISDGWTLDLIWSSRRKKLEMCQLLILIRLLYFTKFPDTKQILPTIMKVYDIDEIFVGQRSEIWCNFVQNSHSLPFVFDQVVGVPTVALIF